MPALGRTTRLQIIKEVDFGVYLDGEECGEILLPGQYVPHDFQIEDWIDVFIYLDSEDRIVATTEIPYAQVGECAYLKVVDLNDIGAFLDWGLAKDLLVPFREQRRTMQLNRSYVVFLYEDNSGRICGSSKLDHYLKEKAEGHFAPNQAVDLLIVNKTDLGYKVVIDQTHVGLLHAGDALATLKAGQKIAGYIKKIRHDDNIDVMMQQTGEELRHSLTHQILTDLEMSGGTSYLTDKSSGKDIFDHYQVSKSNYKKAIGQLYKEKHILIENDKITLIEKDATHEDIE